MSELNDKRATTTQRLVQMASKTEEIVAVKTKNTVNDIFKVGAIFAWLAIAGVCFMYGGVVYLLAYFAVFGLILLGVRFFNRPRKDDTQHWSASKGYYKR